MSGDRAILTIRLSGHTDVSAMGNHDMAERRPVSLRNYVGQIEFQLYRVAVIGQTQSPGQANDVGVTGNPGDAEGVAQDAISRFSPNTGQGQELFHRVGDFAVIMLDDPSGSALDIEGFVAVKSRGSNVRFDLLQIRFDPVGGGLVFPE